MKTLIVIFALCCLIFAACGYEWPDDNNDDDGGWYVDLKYPKPSDILTLISYIIIIGLLKREVSHEKILFLR